MEKITDVAEKLKTLIDSNGPGYLSDDPYGVYKELVGSGIADRKTSGALMFLFTTDIPDKIIPDNDASAVSKLIQRECCFNKKMSDRLAEIVLLLHSNENEEEWKNKDMIGLEQFKKERQTYKWEGHSFWRGRNGGIDCHYEAEVVVEPAKDLVIDGELGQQLKKNPFMKTEAIHEFFEKKMFEYLDYEFEEYCTEDDYYEPVVEDFEIGDYVKDWCKKNGFKMISCRGDGHDDGYEPSFRREMLF